MLHFQFIEIESHLNHQCTIVIHTIGVDLPLPSELYVLFLFISSFMLNKNSGFNNLNINILYEIMPQSSDLLQR